jgi:hypothetical protein
MKAAVLGVLVALVVTLSIAFVARKFALRRRSPGRAPTTPLGNSIETRGIPGNTSDAPDVPSVGWLVCTAGPLVGERFEIRSEGLYIGRDGALAQIVVADNRISKRHVWIGPRGGRITAVDQGSTNGTFLNQLTSQPITETFLNAGDTLILSEFDVARFQFQK